MGAGEPSIGIPANSVRIRKWVVAWKRVEKLSKLLIDFSLAGDRHRNSASKSKTERRRARRRRHRVWSRGVLMIRKRKLTDIHG
jgi:hypothetical protein